ncbi:MAG: sulfatase-like hydrolase/transferase [Chitinivibrionales bacterium]|nr:sulfatase-like hydrolase/transferase [Chitinivibrionales bacterium]
MASAKPNVIIVMTDDQGYGDLGCHGNPVAYTPHLDALHDDAVRLTDFHAAPMCTPSRGQLLTGLDAARNGAVNVSSGRTLLRPDVQTMADRFRESGYRTGLFGKWHLGDNYPFRPRDRGFQETLWFPSSHIHSLPDYWENDYFDDVYCRNGTRERYEGYCTEVFFREAMAWMRTCIDKQEPFFAYLPTNAPHAPLWVPQRDRELIESVFAENEHLLPRIEPDLRARIIRFLAMIHTVDRQVGALREFLAAQGADRNTILMFMTDNGSTFGPTYYNAGMKGAKCSLWEGGHRVPCFIHWPDGALGAPRNIEGLTQMQDILPTLIELCGLQPATGMPLDGISLASVLRDEEPVPPDRILAVNYSRMPRFDYPTPDCEAVIRREGSAVLWKRWRLLEGTALYDLDSDPLQERNVIEQYPDIAARMTDALDTWWRDVEPVANQVQRVVIGSEEENPMMLSACEWRDVFVDQQRQVRVGTRRNSYWHLEVARAGTYRFELRRWPRESGLKLTEACAAAQVTDGELDEGVALPIAQARLMIARHHYVQKTSPDDQAAVFTLQLDAGPTLLHTWFDDTRREPICGAYYVYVSRVE